MAATDMTTEEVSASPRRWVVLAVMSLGTMLVFIDNTVINTALPSISRDLRASTSELQWTIDAYVLVLAGLLMLGGSLGDRFGRKRWMSVGLVIFGGASVLGAMADSVTTLIVARGLQGLGAALVLPATLSIITNVFPRKERARAIATWTAVGGIGIGLGPALGGWLVDTYDWSAAFWIHIPLVALVLIGMLAVPESRDHRGVGLDFPGAVLGTAGIGALVYGIISAGESGWTDTVVLGSLAVAAVALASFAYVEARSDHPMLPLSFFRRADFTGPVTVIGLILFAMLVTFFFLTQFFQIVQGRDAFAAGLLILPSAAGMTVGSGAAGALISRLGPRNLIVLAVTIMTAGVVLLTTLDVNSSALAISMNLLVFGIGAGLALAPLTDTVMAAVPENEAGIGSAVNDVSRELGGALGIALIGSIVSGLYRGNVADNLEGRVPEGAIEVAQEGIGVAAVAAEELPPDVANRVLNAATDAFMSSMSTGFWISIGFMVLAGLVALRTLPRRMVPANAKAGDTAAGPLDELMPAPEPA